MNEISFLNPRYRLHDSLGTGGMGQVFRAYDRLTGSDVALKRLHLHAEKTMMTTQQFSKAASDDLSLTLAREFHILASLRHRHIVEVRDYGFDQEGQPFYTMTLVEQSRTLLQAGRGQALHEQLRLIGETLLALAYLHRRGILHRDLKPDNVLVTPEGTVKVVDFGLAINELSSTPSMGTLLYAAPEALRMQPTDQRADLYAVGLIAYELLTDGEYPFGTSDIEGLIAQITTQEVDFTILTRALLAHQVGPEMADGITAVVRRMMHFDLSVRYANAIEALVALFTAAGLPLPSETAELRESYLQAARFVGREAELSRLKSALQQALDGKGSAWLIGGESGVGKTRLLDEIRTRALVNGALLLRGQAADGGGLPYQLWRDPTRRLVLSVEVSDLEAGILKPLVPDIERLLERTVADAPELPGEAGQQRLALTITDLIRRYAQPLVLLLEDLQWTGESLVPLKRLNEVVGSLPLLIVASYRDDERPNLPDDLPGMQVISLRRLSETETAELSRSMLGEMGATEPLVTRLQQETEGNVFFLVEVVRALAEAAGGLEHVGRMTMPRSILAGGVQKIMQRRLERVPEWGQALLQMAAVAGRQLDLAVLGDLVKADAALLVGHTLGEWLRVCADVSVLEVADERWRFAHDKLREHLLAELLEDAAKACHRAVAEALERVYASDALRKPYLETLLLHWRGAGEVERELHYLLEVVEDMISRRGVYDEADVLIGRGLTYLDDNDTRRAALLNWRSDNYLRHSDYEGARENAQAAIDLGRRLGAKQEIVRGLKYLGDAALDLGDNRLAANYFQQSIDLAREIGHPRGISINLYGLGRVARRQGDFEAAERYFRESMTVFEKIGYTLGIISILNNLGLIADLRGDAEAAERYYQQSLALAHEVGDKLGIANTLNNLGFVAKAYGQYTAAEQYFQRSLALAHELGEVFGVANCLSNLAILELEHEPPYKLSYVCEGLKISLEVGTVPVTLELVITAARIALRQGAVVEAAHTAGMVHVHPATSQETREDFLADLLHELRTALPPDDLNKFMTEGEQMELDAVASDWLARINCE